MPHYEQICVQIITVFKSFRALINVSLACEPVPCRPCCSHTNRTFTLLSAYDKLNTAGWTLPWSLAHVSQTWSPHGTECLHFSVFDTTVFVLTDFICHSGAANCTMVFQAGIWSSFPSLSACPALCRPRLRKEPLEKGCQLPILKYTWKISF